MAAQTNARGDGGSYLISADVDFFRKPVTSRTERSPDVPCLHHLHQVCDDLKQIKKKNTAHTNHYAVKDINISRYAY